MISIIKKPLFWSNVAAFLVTGFVVAGVAFGWNNPAAAPVGGNGAIRTDLNGNVRIGGIGNPLAKLHVSGDLLVDASGGITLGGVEKNDWLMEVGSTIACTQNTTYFLCMTTGEGVIYGLYLQLPSGTILNPTITSTSAPGVTPNSHINCTQNTTYFLCMVTGTGRIYGTHLQLPSGTILNPTITSTVASDVKPTSRIGCTQNITYFLCMVSGTDKVYGAHLQLPSGTILNPTITSTSAPGVSVPQ